VENVGYSCYKPNTIYCSIFIMKKGMLSTIVVKKNHQGEKNFSHLKIAINVAIQTWLLWHCNPSCRDEIENIIVVCVEIQLLPTMTLLMDSKLQKHIHFMLRIKIM
jgi:hypothetical protein